MTKTYALLLLILAIAFLILGIRAWIKIFSSKEIIKFPFSQKESEFTIQTSGHYAIYIHAKKFKLLPRRWMPIVKSISSLQKIEIKTSFFAVKTTGLDSGKMERFGFEIETPGKYSIQITEGELSKTLWLRKVEEALIPKGLFSEANLNDVFISIRKGPSLVQKMILFPQLFLAFVGLFGIVFSSILIANPKAFDDLKTGTIETENSF